MDGKGFNERALVMPNRSTMAGILVLFVLGLSFGSVFFPRTVTQTETQTTVTTSVTTTTITTNSSISVVTATVVRVDVLPYVATCTTVSGTVSIVFRNVPGEITSVTTVYPSNLHLPHEYLVTQVTASTGTVSTDVDMGGNTC